MNSFNPALIFLGIPVLGLVIALGIHLLAMRFGIELKSPARRQIDIHIDTMTGSS